MPEQTIIKRGLSNEELVARDLERYGDRMVTLRHNTCGTEWTITVRELLNYETQWLSFFSKPNQLYCYGNRRQPLFRVSKLALEARFWTCPVCHSHEIMDHVPDGWWLRRKIINGLAGLVDPMR